MAGGLTPRRDPQPPNTTVGYLIYRTFNLLEQLLKAALKSWPVTIRAILIMLLVVHPLLKGVNLQAAAGRTLKDLAAELGLTPTELGSAVLAFGSLALLVNAGVRRYREQRRQKQQSRQNQLEQQKQLERPAHPSDEKEGPETAAPPINPQRDLSASAADQQTQQRVAPQPRQDTDKDRRSEPNQPR